MSSISTICNSIISIFTVNARVHYDTRRRLSFTVHSAKLRYFAVSESTWSLQLRENKDFNVEEKGSELIEQPAGTETTAKKEERLRKRRKRDQERRTG